MVFAKKLKIRSESDSKIDFHKHEDKRHTPSSAGREKVVHILIFMEVTTSSDCAQLKMKQENRAECVEMSGPDTQECKKQRCAWVADFVLEHLRCA